MLLGSGYALLQSSRFQTFAIGLITKQLSRKTDAIITIGKVDIALFKKVVLQDVTIERIKNDTIIHTHLVTANIDSLKIRKRRITLSELKIADSQFKLLRDSSANFNFTSILDSVQREKDTSAYWTINCNQFSFADARISYQDQFSKNETSFTIQDMNLNISGFRSNKDSTVFMVNKMVLNDGKNLSLQAFRADVTMAKEKISLSGCNFKTDRSVLDNTTISILLADENSRKDPELEISIGNSNLSFKELAELIPGFKGMDQQVKVSGNIYGDINDLKGRNISVKTGRDTEALIDFYINGLRDAESMYLFVDLKNSQTTLEDINSIRLPNQMKIERISFPETMYQAGMLRFTGNFSGFLSDFVTFGTLESDMGIIKTDVSVIPRAGETLRYRGNISTTEFDLGGFINNHWLGDITFNGEVDGDFNSLNKTISGVFKGNIDQFEVNDYTYSNIELDGIYLDKMFDGLLSINDSNLQCTFLGQLDLNNDLPDFDFHLNLDKAHPGHLNLSRTFPFSEMSFDLRAKFTGNQLDNLKGLILVDDGFYKNRNGQFGLKGVQLLSVPGDSSTTLSLTSEFFDVEISGSYDFQNILGDFRKFINHYLPAVNYNPVKSERPNLFDFRISMNELDSILNVFIPELKVETPFFLYGKMDAANHDFQLEGSLPGFQYKDFWFRNVFIGNKIIEGKYDSKFKISEVLKRNGMKIYNLSLNSVMANNLMDTRISWSNDQRQELYNSMHTITQFEESEITSYPHITVSGSPGTVYIGDTPWNIDAYSSTIDSTTFKMRNFYASQEDQELFINGTVSQDQEEVISVIMNNLNLDYIYQTLKGKGDLKGNINGSLAIANLYADPMVLSNITIDSLHYMSEFIGTAALTNHWSKSKSALNSVLSVNKQGKQTLNASGSFKPSANQFEYAVEVDSMPTSLLGTVIKRNLSNFSGLASGKLKVGGNNEKILLNGAVHVDSAKLTIDYTQVNYGFSDSIYFMGDTIFFDRISIRDENNNQGVFHGTLVHENFKNMAYDLSITTPKILALNTRPRDNGQFHGDIYANGIMEIVGKGKSIRLQGSATTLPGTSVIISMDYEGDMAQYDFLEFVTSESSEKQAEFFNQQVKGDFNLNLNIEVTPDADVQLVYNSRIGDVIKSKGEGIILFEMNKDGDVSLSGDYSITQGEYLFTLQNVVNKRFTIEPGGRIMWSGSPYDANIELKAVYKLKASLYDLLVNQYNNIYQNQRIPVECNIILNDELSSPTISFDIGFPTVEERIRDEVQQFFSTDEDMNRQILSLLILGKFYTPEYMRGEYEAQNPNLIGTTASELFSNQLSNWLSQINDNVDVGLNYRPGNTITNDEIELALGTQIFNDRVTLNGNIGNNANPNSTNSSQIVGDFDMKVKIVPSGKIEFKAFNRSNNNLVYETAPYTQGIGLTFKEEYNSFNELLKKLASIFKRKNKR